MMRWTRKYEKIREIRGCFRYASVLWICDGDRDTYHPYTSLLCCILVYCSIRVSHFSRSLYPKSKFHSRASFSCPCSTASMRCSSGRRPTKSTSPSKVVDINCLGQSWRFFPPKNEGSKGPDNLTCQLLPKGYTRKGEVQ